MKWTPQKIRDLRAALKWRREDLATHLKCSMRSITRWESFTDPTLPSFVYRDQLNQLAGHRRGTPAQI